MPKFDGGYKFQFHNLNFTHATPNTGVEPAQIYTPKNVAQIHPRHQIFDKKQVGVIFQAQVQT